MDAVRGAFFLILLIAAVILFAVKGQEIFKKETFEKTILPASVAINFKSEDQGQTLQYIGRSGYSVLDLLRQTSQVRTFNTNRAWVRSINKQVVGPKASWTYSVDGESTDIPPGQYKAKENQEIVWRYKVLK